MQGMPFEPSEEQRKVVRTMSGFGIPQEDIATFLDIDTKTLRKHFRRDLDRGMVEATAKVAQSLFQMATTGNNGAAAIFWTKARAGWREKQDIRLGPTQMDQMSDAALDRMIQHVRGEIAEIDEQTDDALLSAETPPHERPRSTPTNDRWWVTNRCDRGDWSLALTSRKCGYR